MRSSTTGSVRRSADGPLSGFPVRPFLVSMPLLTPPARCTSFHRTDAVVVTCNLWAGRRYRHNHADMMILKQMKGSFEARNSVCHSVSLCSACLFRMANLWIRNPDHRNHMSVPSNCLALLAHKRVVAQGTVLANALMHCGTTSDLFVRENMDSPLIIARPTRQPCIPWRRDHSIPLDSPELP